MKLRLLAALSATIFILISPATSAALVDIGDGLIYDDVLDITWAQPDASNTSRNWDAANTWASGLTLGGVSGWRLPYISVAAGAGPFTGTAVDCSTTSELSCRDNEMGYMFYHNLGGTFDQPILDSGDPDLALFPTLQSWGYWSSTESDPGFAWYFNFIKGNQNFIGKFSQTNSWAVHSGNVRQPVAVAAASLPSSRSVQVGDTATAFATIINPSTTAATDCSIVPLTLVPADFSYQTTDASNVPVGTPNTPVDIPAGESQSYVFASTPVAPFSPVEVLLNYDCTNIDPAPVTVGLNTLLLSASGIPVPDIVALVATPSGDGIVDLPGTNGSNAFAVATVNVGSTDTVTAAAVPAVTLPLFLSICETSPATGACLSTPASSTTSSVGAGATPTYSVFVTGNGMVPFDPTTNRITVEFKDGSGVTRGSTSVAVRTL